MIYSEYCANYQPIGTVCNLIFSYQCCWFGCYRSLGSWTKNSGFTHLYSDVMFSKSDVSTSASLSRAESSKTCSVRCSNNHAGDNSRLLTFCVSEIKVIVFLAGIISETYVTTFSDGAIFIKILGSNVLVALLNDGNPVLSSLFEQMQTKSKLQKLHFDEH